MDKLIAENASGRLLERADRMGATPLAHRLSSVAVRQWERALTGMAAVPAAAALSAAAMAMYGVAMTERLFEVLESGIGEIGRSMLQDDTYHRERNADRPEARA